MANLYLSTAALPFGVLVTHVASKEQTVALLRGRALPSVALPPVQVTKFSTRELLAPKKSITLLWLLADRLKTLPRMIRGPLIAAIRSSAKLPSMLV